MHWIGNDENAGRAVYVSIGLYRSRGGSANRYCSEASHYHDFGTQHSVQAENRTALRLTQEWRHGSANVFHVSLILQGDGLWNWDKRLLWYIREYYTVLWCRRLFIGMNDVTVTGGEQVKRRTLYVWCQLRTVMYTIQGTHGKNERKEPENSVWKLRFTSEVCYCCKPSLAGSRTKRTQSICVRCRARVGVVRSNRAQVGVAALVYSLCQARRSVTLYLCPYYWLCSSHRVHLVSHWKQWSARQIRRLEAILYKYIQF